MSSGEVHVLKRVYLNVLSGEKKYRAMRRDALGNSVMAKWMQERGWQEEEEEEGRLVWRGEEEQARRALEELLQPLTSSSSSSSSLEAQDAGAEVAAEVAEAVAREEAAGLWRFPCCLRFSPRQFMAMAALLHLSEEQVYGALLLLVRSPPSSMRGALALESPPTFRYTRNE